VRSKTSSSDGKSIEELTTVAKYRAQLLEPEKKSAKGEGFDVLKSGGESIICDIALQLQLTSRRPSVYDRFPVRR